MIIFITSGCGGSKSSTPPQTNSSPSTHPVSSAPTTLRQIANDIRKHSDISGIILLSQTGNLKADVVASGIDLEQEHLFKIASISKLFMAVAVTKLVNENALDLRDFVSTWLPELSLSIANAESATLKHLITHRSGIPDFDSQPGFSWDRSHTDIVATLKLIEGKPADFNPGERYAYSNSNYLLLGLVMDKVLGFSHELYIQNEILAPLGMKDTYLQQAYAPQDSLITGYWNGRDKKAQKYAIPGGSMVASAEDIAMFMGALNRGELLNEQEANLYVYYHEHTGWLPGYQSIARYDALSDTVILVFTTNTGGESSSLSERAFNQIRNIVRQRGS
ncbi:beta-lactamase family protein [Alteromonas ponticola]|uniref:Beta-lactamase family protein n=1 Tax=Alteromonas aquimaris TaxID=2998417 RepID=A0ABT3P2P4_9ALTE|nr:serine hydrolase [Alteromonas aquimaris]MCW8107023.1 beta-lactamase family protein [Alteromonas aquimaris]